VTFVCHVQKVDVYNWVILSVGIATRLDGPGIGVRFSAGTKYIVFFITLRPALGLIQSSAASDNI
jgi:hypothetical protein